MYETVKSYLENLDEQLKVDEQTYKDRLSRCKSCKHLISGMCLKCGCYVEIRAALKDEQCPNYDDKLW